ncbi:(Fe-S)-binding protein [Paenibacillus validus]|uniref:4Fe-4S dicluster domain-containing protein n=1 Tax=Paenibacillus validus TaxID=44253 RepID=A0A7X3CTS3_9BACL|nr:(Fe-S)-binding protein [Paenibacillus validus]MUG72757.1 4Fe-4S dicluster domain-containing protein [Paenibacillus validus]
MRFSGLVFTLAFLILLGYSLFTFWKVMYARYKFIQLGQPEPLGGWGERITGALYQIFGHSKLFKDRKSGLAHLVIFYGFIVLQFGAVELILKGFVKGYHWPLGSFHPVFSLSQEFTVMAIILAVGYAAYRRFGEKLPRLKQGAKTTVLYGFIFLLMASILLTLAFEKVWLGELPSGASPISSLLSLGLAGAGQQAAYWLFYACWWLHLLILLAFLLYVPQSKHAHLLFAPFNIVLSSMGPPGRPSKLDFSDETAEEFGVGKIEHFTKGQLLDLYACVECGRCTNVCPASNTGKMLSPMHLITKLRDHMNEKGEVLLAQSPWAPGRVMGSPQGMAHAMSEVPCVQGEPEGYRANSHWHTDIAPTMRRQEQVWQLQEKEAAGLSLIGDVISEEELWGCTTCRNCEDQCPVGNEHLSLIYGMRRYLVMTEGSMPAEVTRTLNHIERQGNPWGMNRNDRVRWRDEYHNLDIPTVDEVKQFEYLFWVGSMGSYDNRNRKVIAAFAKIMNEAGISFAILGNEELNSGDTVRRVGNEFLFQELAQQNIELFTEYGVKKIVTCDPHAFNSFKNEYPDFGWTAEVYHHTQLISQWIKEGRIKPEVPVEERVVYHDSCYLGRYNGIYDAPRDILNAIPGVQLLEMKRNKENSMCCGAGGGKMWIEEQEGVRVNVKRVEQALDGNPTAIGSNCPYCLIMMGDGLKQFDADEQVAALDLAELVVRSLGSKA